MSSNEPDATNNASDSSARDEPRLPTRRGETERAAASPADKAPSGTVEKPFPSLAARLLPARSSISKRSPWRWLRRSLITFAVMLLAVAGALIVGAVWLRHSMRAALPQIDGELHVAGLSSSVTVTRDAQGVPSLQASTLDDLLFAQGFVTAQDRLWQMDAVRRHAAGELAEILGARLIEHDRTQRILQLRATADRAVAALPADQLHQLEMYARGVNAFIAQNSDKLPVEFHLLHYAPAQWTPRDSMLVSLAMFQDLSTEFPTKMRREALMAHLPAELSADLYPTGSWRDHPPTQPPPDLTTPKPEIEEIPLDDSQVKLRAPQLANPGDILQVLSPGDECATCRSGSNNWAIAGSHSASGFPLLSNDMHLGLNVPDIWYEAALHCPSATGMPALDVTGFTLPGAPFVIVGRNAHVAWGFTNLGADVQDIRIEHTRGSGNETEYQKPDGTWVAAGHASETIHVRGGHDIVLDVLTTTAMVGASNIVTPVISPLYPSEHRTLSLAWTAYDSANLSVPFLAVNTAGSGTSLVASFAGFGGPSLNLIYADDAKHIGYHALGRIAVRGSTEHKPRPVAEPILQNGPIAPDEGAGGNAQEPQAVVTAPNAHRGPFLLEAAYGPSRRAVQRKEIGPKKAASSPKPEAPIPTPPPAIDYTIGSPIASVPVDALDPAQQWVAYIPYDQLPSSFDPADGVLATANARVSPDDYPYSLTNDWGSPYRVEHINKLLAERNGLTPADMLAVQTDIHSQFDLVVAQRLAYAIDHASPAVIGSDPKRLRQAADLLRRWDGTMSPDSSAAAIVMAFRGEVWRALLVPQITAHDGGQQTNPRPEEIAALYLWQEQSVALETLLQHQPARWLPAGVANWNDLLATTLAHAFSKVHAPSNLATWRYGLMHPVEIAHPVFSLTSMFDRVLGVQTGSGVRETGGDGETIKAAGRRFGPSERFTADLVNADTTYGNITTGESGNPASPWYLDQFVPWLKGTAFALPLHPANTPHTLTLLP